MQENNTAGYKHTPIGLLPTDWIVDIIENLGQVKRGAGSQYLNYLENDGIRFIRINDFFENNPVYVEATKAILRFCIEDNDILFAGTGASAGASYIPKKEWLGLPHSYNAPRIRVNSNQNRQFILYSLQSDYIAKQQKELFVGAAQPFLDTTAIANFIIAIPPLPEQQKIATILSTWDAAIDNCKAIIEKLQQRNKGLAQQLLTGKMRVKGFEESKWKDYELRDVFNFEQPNKYLTNEFENDDSLAIPVLTANKSFILGYTADTQNSYKKFPVIIFDDFTTASKYVDFEFKIKSSAIKLLSIKEGFYLRFAYERLQIIETNIQDHKRRWISEFENKIIAFPYLEEQKAIANILDTATSELNQYQQQLQTLQQQKKGLMQQLLTGKTRVKI